MEFLEVISIAWYKHEIPLRTIQHLEMFSISVSITLITGILLGIAFFRSPKLRKIGIPVLNTMEMIPDIALLILLIPLVGIGVLPTVSAAILYSILPVTRHTAAGLAGVDPALAETADALGLTPMEILLKIRLPLALPLIAVGARTAVIFCMGIATLGGIVGAGGLGAPLQTGITTKNSLLILLVGCWVVLLAVTMDALTAGIGRLLSRRYGGYA